MNLFARIIKWYIMLALERAGVNITSDTHAELDDAIQALDRHIQAQVIEQIALHEQAKHADGAK